MRILQICSAKHFAGGERHLVDLIKGLRGADHDIFVALRRENDFEKLFSFLPKQNFFHLPLANSIDVYSAVMLAQLIRRHKIEIVHAHLARDYAVAASAVFLARPARLVLTRHLLLPLKPFHKFTASQTSAVIAVSGAVREALINQRIFPVEKIELVRNGADIEHFAQNSRLTDKTNLLKRLRISPDAALVGTVGELKNIKGQDLFLRAAALVAEKFPNAHFVIAGADNSPQKKYEDYLKSLAADLNLAGRAHFIGFVEDIAPLMRGIDVFVSAARTEPFGLVLIEAMAARAAVVAAATEGAREILSDGETGKTVPLENASALANAIGEFLSDAQMREDFGRKAQNEARRNFSLEKMTRETEEIYRKISGADF